MAKKMPKISYKSKAIVYIDSLFTNGTSTLYGMNSSAKNYYRTVHNTEHQGKYHRYVKG